MKIQMITKALLTVVCVAYSTSDGWAQRKDDPKHENHYQVKPLETDDVSLSFSGAHSQQEFTEAKIKITNKTNDYILYKAKETVFKYPFGEFNPGTGMFRGSKTIVKPLDSESRVLKVTGGTQFHVEGLQVILNGFSRVSSEGVVQEAPDFKLPASVNDFKAGTSFKCSLEKLVKETDETKATFKCTYIGTDIGLLDPTKIVLKLENGQEYATDNKKDKVELMLPKEEEKVVATFHVPGKVTDMQFANMVLVWKNTFSESKVVPIATGSVDFVLDPGATEAKNK